MNWDRVEGNWNEFKGRVQQQWAKLTNDDLAQVNGKRTELCGRLQQRYGYAKDQAEREIDTWLTLDAVKTSGAQASFPCSLRGTVPYAQGAQAHQQTDGAACLALWRNEGRVESRPPRRRLKPRVALSPVCEPIGSTVKKQHHADEQQILYETELETASNY